MGFRVLAFVWLAYGNALLWSRCLLRGFGTLLASRMEARRMRGAPPLSGGAWIRCIPKGPRRHDSAPKKRAKRDVCMYVCMYVVHIHTYIPLSQLGET